MKTIRLIVLAFFLIPVSQLITAAEYTMPNTHMHPLSTATTINQDYLLYVHLPESYDANSNANFPVLYLLDPWWDFPVVAGAHSGLVYDGVIPPMIIVGVGYANLALDPNVLRNTDYTPVPIPGLPNSGDAGAFLDFISEKVIPFIENKYRVDKEYRVLAGSSYGGLFTLFTLFEKPNLFQGHIAISPAVGFNDKWLFQKESRFFTGTIPPTLNTNLYMAVGSQDQLENFTNEAIAFNQVIKDRPYAGFNFKFEVRKNEHHASAKLGAFSQGLSHAFSAYTDGKIDNKK